MAVGARHAIDGYNGILLANDMANAKEPDHIYEEMLAGEVPIKYVAVREGSPSESAYIRRLRTQVHESKEHEHQSRENSGVTRAVKRRLQHSEPHRARPGRHGAFPQCAFDGRSVVCLENMGQVVRRRLQHLVTQ